MIFVDFPIIYIVYAPLLSVITNIDKKNTPFSVEGHKGLASKLKTIILSE